MKNDTQIRCYYVQNDTDISPHSHLQIRILELRRTVGVLKLKTNYCIFIDIDLSRKYILTVYTSFNCTKINNIQ